MVDLTCVDGTWLCAAAHWAQGLLHNPGQLAFQGSVAVLTAVGAFHVLEHIQLVGIKHFAKSILAPAATAIYYGLTALDKLSHGTSARGMAAAAAIMLLGMHIMHDHQAQPSHAQHHQATGSFQTEPDGVSTFTSVDAHGETVNVATRGGTIIINNYCVIKLKDNNRSGKMV